MTYDAAGNVYYSKENGNGGNEFCKRGEVLCPEILSNDISTHIHKSSPLLASDAKTHKLFRIFLVLM